MIFDTTELKMASGVNKVPPDGGYGWVVTFAYALNNVSQSIHVTITFRIKLDLAFLVTPDIYLLGPPIAYISRNFYSILR